ncbi:hypothetical protein SDRG_14809 [Saprolegnia diclina VS20]|uniref:Uncharacterized protein n=1 Tax=Saprolegnia diclina (strain VS20) TaxID=1156394 RepID=T0RCR3_SAPDV|nr:hypothetical protein SDRG_14809 [Saprolegnia diclina VS20]EQC27367.1 hypothetical protein SDRG_14809 [Saprolegnia diclina VS20]|eukprot:XP_008619186.1 hypothetical protein SDRG_14809 [Saprolegnia diclina VS20]
MTVPHAASTSVLTDASLLRSICAYQYGFFADLLPRLEEGRAMTTTTIGGLMQYELPPRYAPLVDTLAVFGSFTLYLHPFERDARCPLHLAIFEGQLDVVKRFLGCRGRAWLSADAFYLAVQRGHDAIVRYLCEKRLCPSTDGTWRDALALAARHKRTRVVAVLQDAHVVDAKRRHVTTT